jgi:predicted enzyme related to lactoylglutathione lyase
MALVATAEISDLDPAGARIETWGRDGDTPTDDKERRSMIKGVKFASIPVTDQDRALAFYTEKLGFTVFTDQPFDGKQRWIELRIPGAETGVVLFTADGHEDRIGTFQGISFTTDDVTKTYETLVERGVEFAGPPQSQKWGSYVILKDPDGNAFVVGSR